MILENDQHLLMKYYADKKKKSDRFMKDDFAVISLNQYYDQIVAISRSAV